ncbi:MAG: hypothetical protein K2Y40_24740 [Reyranella sp.]|jgi:hypothetical protein|nr:hypothetical protein [Reyranella sp.]
MPTDSENAADTLARIERQLEKVRATADNLDALSAAPKTSDPHAKRLSDQAVDLRLKQFSLYRKKDRILATSNEWKAVVAGVELLNERIERAIEDQKKVSEVITTAATVLSVIVGLLGAIGGVV